MALATQCPHCHTTFRVANDQLKLHAGIVRCGSCQQIFNGVEHLVAPAAPTAAAPAPSSAAWPPQAQTSVSPTAPAAAAAAADSLRPSARFTEVTPAPVQVPPVAPSEAVPLSVASSLAPAVVAVAAKAAAVPSSDLLDFDLSDFGAAPAETRREPAWEAQPEPDAEPNSANLDEESELQQRIAMLERAEADWSLADDSAPALNELGQDEAAVAADTVAPKTEPREPTQEEIDALEHALADFEAQFEAAPPGEIKANREEHIQAELAQAAENDAFSNSDILIAAPRHISDDSDDVEADAHAATLPPLAATEEYGSHAEEEAPGFVLRARRERARSRGRRIAMGLGAIVLLGTLAAQAAYGLRNQLAAWFPQVKPQLVLACQSLGCHVDLPTQIDAISLESSDLQPMAPNKSVFALNLLLRNSSSTVQAWPMLELTLNNGDEQAVLRRVLTPTEYLSNKADPAKGFAAASEQPVKLYFELNELKASGYRVWLFYP